MDCPQCGYRYRPFERECPRCARYGPPDVRIEFHDEPHPLPAAPPIPLPQVSPERPAAQTLRSLGAITYVVCCVLAFLQLIAGVIVGFVSFADDTAPATADAPVFLLSLAGGVIAALGTYGYGRIFRCVVDCACDLLLDVLETKLAVQSIAQSVTTR